ncbi:MAG: metallophosphoesterase family protein [Syntrophales bacterium]
MRYLVVSDTHGNRQDLRDAVGRYGPFDGLIHLGDGILDGRTIAEESGIPFYGVRGNEDYGSRAPDMEVLDLGGRPYLLLHGFQLDMNPYHPPSVWRETLAELAKMAEKRNARGVLFGHTHQALLELFGGTLLLNPGDQYLGAAIPSSFAVIETANGETRIALYRKGGPERWHIFTAAYFRDKAAEPFYP